MCNQWNNAARPASWYEVECDVECRECVQKENKLEEAKEYLVAVVEQLYSKGSLDVGMLESNLDELCHYLCVKVGQGTMNIQRPVQPRPDWLNDWVKLAAQTH